MTIDQIAEKLDQVCRSVDKIELQLNSLVTPPNVETRIKAYVDDRDEHKQNNASQALMQVQTILKQGQEIVELKLENQIRAVKQNQDQTEKDRTADHIQQIEFQKQVEIRLARLERYVSYGLGAVAVIQIVLKFMFK